MTCLLMVDDSEIREAIARALKKRGFRVALAHDHAEALSLLATALPAEVVLVGGFFCNHLQFLSEIRTRIPVLLAGDFVESGLKSPVRGRRMMTASPGFVFSLNGRSAGIEDLARVIRVVSGKQRQAVA